MERTLSIIKPDGVRKGITGEIIRRFEVAGLCVTAIKKIRLSREMASAFYDVHREKPFYDELAEFMSSGPVIAMVLEGPGAVTLNRKLMGATDFRQAEPGTIRADFATSIQHNIVHGSDSPENAAVEIGFFFSGTEIFGRD